VSQIKNALEQIVNCSNCYGLGSTGWVTTNGDYDFEYCECNPLSIPQDEVMGYNQLFAGSEAY
jgi:hypothetical protein